MLKVKYRILVERGGQFSVHDIIIQPKHKVAKKQKSFLFQLSSLLLVNIVFSSWSIFCCAVKSFKTVSFGEIIVFLFREQVKKEQHNINKKTIIKIKKHAPIKERTKRIQKIPNESHSSSLFVQQSFFWTLQ